MPEKPGNGGHGLESYDPETGRYIKEGDSKYHAGAHFSVDEISKMISAGYYGDDFKSMFDAGDDNEKTAIIGYLQTKLDNFYTKNKLENEKDFKMLTNAEFRQYAAECKQLCDPQDYRYFNYNYRGAGDRSFEFNKALRTGDMKYLRLIGMSQSEFDAQVAAFDRLTSVFEAPKDMQGIRFDQTGPIVSWFKGSGVLDGLPTYLNEYGYEQLNQRNLDLDDLKNRLSRLIGSVVKRDGAYSSFSCVDEGNNKVASHMVKNSDKIIAIRYNIPKGKHIFLSDYQYESEGMFPRDTKFIIQDVKKENIGGQERVVLYYGVE